MFLLSKLFTFLLLPPGLFVMMTLLCLILLIFKKKIALVVVLIVQLGLLYTLSITPIKNALLLPLEDAHSPPSIEQIEDTAFIVILGGGVIPESPAAEVTAKSNVGKPAASGEASPENGTLAPEASAGAGSSAITASAGTLSPAAYKRTGFAASLYRLHPVPIVVSGGVVFRAGVAEPEAVIAKRTLQQLGIPEGAILIEGESKNTWQNAAFTAAIVEDGPVLLVTSAYHMRRSVSSFEKHGVRVVPAPTDYRSERVPYNFFDFLPNMNDFYDSFAAIHEYIGMLYYSVKKADIGI